MSEEKRLIECPECKSHIREDARKCPHCRSKVFNDSSGIDEVAKTLSYLLLFGVFIILANIADYLDSVLGTNLSSGDNIIYALILTIILTLFIAFHIDKYFKKRSEKKREEQKVYVD